MASSAPDGGENNSHGSRRDAPPAPVPLAHAASSDSAMPRTTPQLMSMESVDPRSLTMGMGSRHASSTPHNTMRTRDTSDSTQTRTRRPVMEGVAVNAMRAALDAAATRRASISGSSGAAGDSDASGTTKRTGAAARWNSIRNSATFGARPGQEYRTLMRVRTMLPLMRTHSADDAAPSSLHAHPAGKAGLGATSAGDATTTPTGVATPQEGGTAAAGGSGGSGTGSKSGETAAVTAPTIETIANAAGSATATVPTVGLLDIPDDWQQKHGKVGFVLTV